MRFFLAATLSSVYGIYNGFELIEHVPVPGKEELLNSEKYEYKVRDWDAPGNIKGYVKLTRLDEEVVEMIRDVENSSQTDLEAFRDRLATDWIS